MRIADRSSARNYLKYLNQAKANYAKTNQQVASGNRFEKMSDDVSAGTRVMRTRMDLYKSQKHLDNVKTVNDEMTVVEDTMTSMSEILSEAHKLMVKVTSEEKADSGQEAIANEIKALKEQMLYLANSKTGKRYMFGGSNASLNAPFAVGDNGKLTYNGIDVDIIEKDPDGGYCYWEGGEKKTIPMDEEVYLDVGLGLKMQGDRIDGTTGMRISYSGLDVLGFGKTEAGLPNNLYNILSDMEANIRTYDKEALGKLDTQLTARTDLFTGNLTDIGAKTNFLDNMQTRLKSNVDSYKTRIDSLMGVDDKEAAMNLATNDFVLNAVLQMGARVIPTSLMDFLR